MGLEQLGVASAVIIGLVNGVRLASQYDKWGFILFASGVGFGVILGALGYFGLTVETGLAVAIGGSGIYQVASKIGGK